MKGKTCLITGADAYGRLIVHAALGEKSNPEKWQDVLGWVAENDKEWIIQVAEGEFLKNGFSKTSIRKIAQATGTTKSNIYTYFKDKDEIIKAVVQSCLDVIEKMLAFLAEENNFKGSNSHSHSHMPVIDIFVDFILNHRRNLEILLLKSSGSCMENFKEEFISRYSANAEKAFPHHSISTDTKDHQVSLFFIRYLTTSLVQFTEEVIKSNHSANELIEYAQEYLMYTIAGQSSLLKHKKITKS